MLRELPTSIWVLVIAALLVAAFLWSKWQASRRQGVWRRFARRYRLEYSEPQPGQPRVTGRIDQRAVRLALADSGSDREGTYATVLTLAMNAPFPKLEVHQGGLLSVAERAIDGDVVETGDAQFDQQAVVHAASAQEARQFLTPVRRQALAHLLTLNPNYRTGLERGQLYIESRHARTELPDLIDQLNALRNTADALETDR